MNTPDDQPVPLGALVYRSNAGSPGAESIAQRVNGEAFWRSLGAKIRAGARIPAGYDLHMRGRS